MYYEYENTVSIMFVLQLRTMKSDDCLQHICLVPCTLPSSLTGTIAFIAQVLIYISHVSKLLLILVFGM